MRTPPIGLPLSLLVLSISGASIGAQSVVSPNANENVRGDGGSNTLTRDSGNPRTLMLGIPASELTNIPLGSMINGVSFRANFGSSPPSWPPTPVSWSNYEVTVGNAIPLASWTGTFMSNFVTTPLPPVQVRTGPMTIEAFAFTNNGSIQAPLPNSWGTFHWDFQRSFPYLGGDLGILFTHTGSNIVGACFLEWSSPTVNIAFAVNSFRATTGGTTNSAPTVRIHYGYGWGCPGTGGMVPNLVLTNNTTGGGPTSFAIGNAQANALALYVFGPMRTSTPLPNGCTLLTPPAITVAVILSANGRARLNLTLPPTVLGNVEAQAFAIDTGAPGGFTASNGVSFTAR